MEVLWNTHAAKNKDFTMLLYLLKLLTMAVYALKVVPRQKSAKSEWFKHHVSKCQIVCSSRQFHKDIMGS